MVIGKKKVHGNLVNRKYSFKRKGAVTKSRNRKCIELSVEKGRDIHTVPLSNQM